jgi:hypothetical protein
VRRRNGIPPFVTWRTALVAWPGGGAVAIGRSSSFSKYATSPVMASVAVNLPPASATALRKRSLSFVNQALSFASVG